MKTCLQTIQKQEALGKNKEQVASNVENVLTKEGRPTAGETRAQPTIHDSSSNTYLSQAEILAIKRKNPT